MINNNSNSQDDQDDGLDWEIEEEQRREQDELDYLSEEYWNEYY